MSRFERITFSYILRFAIGISFLVGTVLFVQNRSLQTKLTAPRQNTPEISFTIGKNFTLDAVISDLKYFDFIKDETAFRYALEHSKDNTLGNENSLRIENNTIDREAKYTISQSMTAWQIADILLNQGDFSSCDHGCPESNFNPELLPGGDLAPTIKQKYEWVKTYEDCAKAIGHDGGQLSSEQYAERTGIRKCVSPDGREFTQGKDGWSDIPTP
jgi:hypothetical protein